MESYIFANITFGDIQPQNNESKDKTFELLCADFMKIKFNLDVVPALWDDTYTWTEGPPTKWPDWLLYGFQSKFCNNSFTKDEIIDSCNKINDWTQVLCVFTKDNYPSDKNTNNLLFDIHHPKKTKYWWDNYKNHLKSTGLFNDVYFFSGNEFLTELKTVQYQDILYKFFPIQSIKKELYRKNRDDANVDNNIVSCEIAQVENGFGGNPCFYENDLKIAKNIQESYSYRKLAYSATPFILRAFENMEQFISKQLFGRLALYEYADLDEFINKWVDVLNRDTDIKNQYKTELETLISSSEWIFVNYWTQWKSILNYIEENKILFNDKRDA